VNFRFIPVMEKLATSARVTLGFDATTFILGLGYVMGLRSSMILCAGGVFSNFVIVPLIWMIGSHFPDLAVHPGRFPFRRWKRRHFPKLHASSAWAPSPPRASSAL
jgi:uncharacterized oligopeptide transporter (OPT) family protein